MFMHVRLKRKKGTVLEIYRTTETFDLKEGEKNLILRLNPYYPKLGGSSENFISSLRIFFIVSL